MRPLNAKPAQSTYKPGTKARMNARKGENNDSPNANAHQIGCNFEFFNKIAEVL